MYFKCIELSTVAIIVSSRNYYYRHVSFVNSSEVSWIKDR